MDFIIHIRVLCKNSDPLIHPKKKSTPQSSMVNLQKAKGKEIRYLTAVRDLNLKKKKSDSLSMAP